MKRLLIAAAAALVLLSGCRVGPREGKDIIPENTNPPAQEQVIPENTEAPETDAEPDETVPDVTEPAEEEPEETLPAEELVMPEIELPDVDEDVEIYGEVETLFSTISLNVREGPSVDYDSIGHLEKGQRAEVYGEADTGWYLILFGDEWGFVSGGYMEGIDEIQTDPYSEEMIAEAEEDFGGDAVFVRFLGEYDAGSALLMRTGEGGGSEEIGWLRFESAPGEEYFIYDGRRFTALKEAYDSGDITDRELAEIFEGMLDTAL